MKRIKTFSLVFTTLLGQEAKCNVMIEVTIINNKKTKIRYDDDNDNK